MSTLPSFANPPVVETATSVQFPRLKEFRNQHLWEFWDSYLKDQYPVTKDQHPLDANIEVFGADRPLQNQIPILRKAGADIRMQALTECGHGMVQIQNGRIIYNWRKLDSGHYPHWPKTFNQFEKQLSNFRDFISSRNLGSIGFNQWEVVYVNHLFKGVDWKENEDWPCLLPKIIPKTSVPAARPESLDIKLQFISSDFVGRFYIGVEHAFLAKDRKKELLVLKLTSRGPIESECSLAPRLDAGRKMIVKTFASITGEQAHIRWGKESE